LVDIHSHVLYGLDDGALTIQDSLAMLKMAAEHGTTDLVATPHANLEFRFDPECIADRVARIREASDGRIRLYTGCDFHLTFDNIQDAFAHPTKYTINQKNYLLVEFSELIIFNQTPEIFARLGDAGMIPIVTHPERNALLRLRIEQIASWVQNGAKVQVTAQSLLGRFGKRAREFCRLLLDRNLVHVVASDAHNCETRPPRLDEAYDWLAQAYGETLAQTLCGDNPRATLTGEAMTTPPSRPRATRKWYQFWA